VKGFLRPAAHQDTRRTRWRAAAGLLHPFSISIRTDLGFVTLFGAGFVTLGFVTLVRGAERD